MVSAKTVKKKLTLTEKRLKKRLTAFRQSINALILRGGNAHEWKRLSDDIDRYVKETYQPVFDANDFNSGDGFQTSVWGPPTWSMLHLFSLNYRPERKVGYQALLLGLGQVLPCIHCRNNFTKNMAHALADMKQEGYDDVYESRESFSKFIWYLHHNVNKMLGKNLELEPSFEMMRDQLETFRSRCLTPEEIAAAKKKAKESGCLDAVYGAESKARCQISFVPRSDDDLKAVSPISIDPKCVVCKK